MTYLIPCTKKKYKKLHTKVKKEIFIEYSKLVEEYKFFNSKTKKIILSKDLILLDNNKKKNFRTSPQNGKITSKKVMMWSCSFII